MRPKTRRSLPPPTPPSPSQEYRIRKRPSRFRLIATVPLGVCLAACGDKTPPPRPAPPTIEKPTPADAALKEQRPREVTRYTHDGKYSTSAGAALPAAAISTEQADIRKLLMATFDKPEARLQIEPIVVQGERGGRALLPRHGKTWQITVCGGDGRSGAPERALRHQP